MSPPKAVVVAISGPSSSGKTTLARLLRDIFPDSFILHEDDFYKADDEIPLVDGVADWDCAEAIDIPALTEAMAHVRQHGDIPVRALGADKACSSNLLLTLKPTLDSIQDQNAVGPCPVPSTAVAALRAKATAALASSDPEHSHRRPPPRRICFLDGFLLYSPSFSALAPSLDVKMLLRASHARATARRAARAGYVTVQGFWQDPPGYMDRVVWPNYVREHARFFVGGDVEGRLDRDALRREDVCVPQGDALDPDMADTLRSMVDIILEYFEKREEEKSVK